MFVRKIGLEDMTSQKCGHRAIRTDPLSGAMKRTIAGVLTVSVVTVGASAVNGNGQALAQSRTGSVTVDLSVLGGAGSSQNLQRAFGPLLMPNAAADPNARLPQLVPPSRSTSRSSANKLTLKPPSGTSAARTTPRPATTTTPKRPTVVAPALVARPTPPPQIAAKPPAAPPSTAGAPAVPPPPAIPAPPAPVAAAAPTAPAAPAAAAAATAATAAAMAAKNAEPAPTAAPEKAATSPTPPPTQTASLPPATSGKLAPGKQFRLLFDAGAPAVSSASKQSLDDVAKALSADSTLRLQLLAYAGGNSETDSQARRLSLSRALGVRSYLIEKGVRSTRIDVRALGNKSAGGPTDRVDVIVTTR